MSKGCAIIFNFFKKLGIFKVENHFDYYSEGQGWQDKGRGLKDPFSNKFTILKNKQSVVSKLRLPSFN